jgi:hypothetical protein
VLDFWASWIEVLDADVAVQFPTSIVCPPYGHFVFHRFFGDERWPGSDRVSTDPSTVFILGPEMHNQGAFVELRLNPKVQQPAAMANCFPSVIVVTML